MVRTFEEINDKIRKGQAVVLTAEEVSRMGEDHSPREIFSQVDVVTTGTFSPMCSSGAIVNFGHASPPIRMEKITMNDVEVYSGLAAVDAYIGATSESSKKRGYGGAHVIEELITGNDVHLVAEAKGTDCYPRKHIDTYVNKDEINEFYLFNPRNAYQNYGVAVNGTERVMYTYMGKLLPNLGNAMYATSGELSPLLNDPEMRTIGIGTRIFLCGAQGYIVWNGTQFNTEVNTNNYEIPVAPARTIAVIGNAKEMDPSFLKAAYVKGYGVTLYVGIGIAIPIVDVDMAKRVSIRNENIETVIFDYGTEGHLPVGKTNYKVLQSGTLEFNGNRIKTGTLTSLQKSKQIAEKLRDQILRGDFTLTKPVENLPRNSTLNGLKVREKNSKNKNVITETCINCGSCIGVCPTDALFFDENNEVGFNKTLCTDCGLCVDVCPLGLLKMREDDGVH